MKQALRIDDIGPFKFMAPFKAWGPYEEMTSELWQETIHLLERARAKMTVAVTASWVHFDGTLEPFHKKFPSVCQALQKGVNRGVLKIANHGLTHCVLYKNLFRPRLWRGNRQYHREFWDYLPQSLHDSHLKRSQDILEEAFGRRPTILVPPGNVFSEKTLRAAEREGIELINCQTEEQQTQGLRLIGNTHILAFHDKEIVEEGLDWLAQRLRPEIDYVFVDEL